MPYRPRPHHRKTPAQRAEDAARAHKDLADKRALRDRQRDAWNTFYDAEPQAARMTGRWDRAGYEARADSVSAAHERQRQELERQQDERQRQIDAARAHQERLDRQNRNW